MSSSSLSTPRRIDPTERDRSGRDHAAPTAAASEPDAPRDPRTEPRTLLTGEESEAATEASAGSHDGLSPLGPNERGDDDEDR